MPINSKQIDSPAQLNRAQNRISQELAKLSQTPNLTQDQFNNINNWMNREIELMQGYLDANGQNDMPEIIEGFQNKALEIGNQFQVQAPQSARHTFTPGFSTSPERELEFRKWETKQTGLPPTEIERASSQQNPGNGHTQVLPAQAAPAEVLPTQAAPAAALPAQAAPAAALPTQAAPAVVSGAASNPRTTRLGAHTNIVGESSPQNPDNNHNHVYFNPKPKKSTALPPNGQALDSLIKKEIDKLSDALKEMQNGMPKLEKLAANIAQEIAQFSVSKNKIADLPKLKNNCEQFLNTQSKSMKDPLLTRVFHALVTTVKAFLHWLDVIQSKVTGKMIDQPNRNHMLRTPVLPTQEVNARLETFRGALHTMHAEIEKASKKDMPAPK